MKLAVTVTTVPAGSAPIDALKIALVWPAGITTEAGTVRELLLALSVTVVALALVAPIPTEQTVAPLAATVEGVQLKLVNWGTA